MTHFLTVLYPKLACRQCLAVTEHRNIGTDVRSRALWVYECTVCHSTSSRMPVVVESLEPDPPELPAASTGDTATEARAKSADGAVSPVEAVGAADARSPYMPEGE